MKMTLNSGGSLALNSVQRKRKFVYRIKNLKFMKKVLKTEF